MTSPLEIAAKARFASRNGRLCSWKDIGPREQAGEILHMKAALRALAEAEMPEGIIKAATDRIEYALDNDFPDWNLAKHVFYVMLTAIAEEKS